ncbi:MAG: nitrogen regulation protein NR(II) [Pseudomonadota bacterium]
MNAGAQLRTPGLEASDVLNALATGVVVVGADGSVNAANAAAERILHTTQSHILGRSLGSLLHTPEKLLRTIERVARDGNTVVLRDFEIEAVGRSHAARHIDLVVSPYGDELVLIELLDQTVHTQIEHENTLLEQRGVGRTIARQLAHEIKNPLGGLRGAAQLLARRLCEPELSEFTDVIIRESDRLVALVDTMLGPAKPLRPESMNIHKVLQHVVRLVGAESGDDLSVVEDYDPSLPDIELDEDSLIQAVLNVVRNAVQAVDGRGTVTVRSRAVSGFMIADERHALVLRIDVEDSGPGIDPAVADRLFLPLVTSRPDGTGLGLSLAQELVARHGGLIKVTRRTPTVFSLYLPYYAERGEPEGVSA